MITNAAGARLKAYVSRAKQNPRWMLMDSLSRFVSIRSALKFLRAKPSIDQYNLSESAFQNVAMHDFVSALKRDGFCAGLQLPQTVVRDILDFAASAYCYGDANPRYGFRYADKVAAQTACKRVFSLATYFFDDALQPVVDRLANDPLLLAIAAKYLGSRPAITGHRLWWTFAANETEFNSGITTSFFHYDKDDYAGVRLFFYLTPVDADHGPHVVIRGSHVRKKFSQVISLGERRDNDIVGYYGGENLVTIYGEPGAGFAEDPFCFHKATRPRIGDRLMLEVKYATTDYHIFPPPDRSAMANILDAGALGTR
jgi:hypothetical protein